MTLCGFEIAPGEKRQVKLPVPGGEPLEAWLLCGAHPGKTLVVTAGVHGCEYVGILALQKLVETLDCATLYGQVIITHDLTSITYLCDDVLFLYQGRVTENLPVERISETKDEYARKLLGSIVVFDTEESA